MYVRKHKGHSLYGHVHVYYIKWISMVIVVVKEVLLPINGSAAVRDADKLRKYSNKVLCKVRYTDLVWL